MEHLTYRRPVTDFPFGAALRVANLRYNPLFRLAVAVGQIVCEVVHTLRRAVLNSAVTRTRTLEHGRCR